MADTVQFKRRRTAQLSASPDSQHRLQVVIAFGLVYLFWGSTYLFIGMSSAAGIPPFVMCAMRFLIAGPLMLAACAVFGRNIRVSRQEAVRLAIIGGLLLVCVNVVSAWRIQFVHSVL